MSALRERHHTQLTPEASELIDTYFARVHGALLVTAADECEEAVEDLRAAVLDELEGGAGSAADVTRVLAELGPPEVLAAQCSDAVAEPKPDSSGVRSPLSGRVLGVPYELRLPTGARVAASWWDPMNPHVIVPRVFGIGWTVNFGALAVLLGIVRPDDEDEPFASVPESGLAIALVLPLLVAAGLATLIVLYQGSLPAQVAIHYGVNGADRFASKGSALILPIGMTVLGLGFVTWMWVRRRAPLFRVAAGAAATALASISVTVYAEQVASARGASGILLPGLAVSLLLTFGLLVTLSRIGHAAEVRRDLNKTKKGSV